MRHAWQYISQSKRRQLTAAVTTLLIVAAVGVAYYVVQGTGTVTTKIHAGANTGTQPVTLSTTGLTDGVLPGQSETFQVMATNPASYPVHWNTMGGTVTVPNAPGCNPAWFTVTAPAGPFSLTGNSQSSSTGNWTLTFNDSGTDQSACAGAELDVTASITG